MHYLARPLIAAIGAALAMPALAADYSPPPVIEAPPPVVYEQPESGGWYLRGDIDYHWSSYRGSEYITYSPPGTGAFDSSDLKGAFSLGGGIGYQVNNYFRTDLTGDYWFKSKFHGSTSGDCGGVPCVSSDVSGYSALLLLANAYVDFGTYSGITPYVGAGIGGAYVKWDDLENTIDGDTTIHRGKGNWRFAWALMAGASYCLTDDVKLDAGYRFSQIQGGRMFDYAPIAGPGYDKGFNTHEVRAGLRYQFSGASGCAAPEPVYQPEPVYTK